MSSFRDIGQYFTELLKHLHGLIGAGLVNVLFWVWQYGLHGNDIPTAYWIGAAFIGLFISGFQTWRAEHLRIEGNISEESREERARLNQIASRAADEYVNMSRKHQDSGPSALAKLGLQALGSDALIRKAIQEMYARSGTDPWSGWGKHVEDVDLVAFFDLVREKHYNFLSDVDPEAVAKQVRAAAQHGR